MKVLGSHQMDLPTSIRNEETITNLTMNGFVLVGFSDNPKLEILYTSLFLVFYLLALTGNILLIIITSMDESLNSPMYFFLKHLSFLDLCYISVTVPRSIYNSFMQSGNISLGECIVQCFAFIVCGTVEIAMLTLMSYDRYVAICLPLHYDIIMNVRTCTLGVVSAWASGSLSGVMNTAATFSISFCHPKIIQQYFCDIPKILKLSCSNEYLAEVGVTILMTFLTFLCFIFITFSYVHIFSSVLRMSSVEGRAKAFSTCLPHLAVVILFMSAGAFAYFKPHSYSPTAFDSLLTMMYTVVPPTFNPMIYSLRNKAIKSAVKKAFQRRKEVFMSLHSLVGDKFNI